MQHILPNASDFLRAVDIYLKIAYDDAPPSAVRLRLETLTAMPHEDFYQSAVLERDSAEKTMRYMLRLGNQTYPHMKMALYRESKGDWGFIVEEHDQFGTPAPGSREYRFFAQMIAHNRELAVAIEKAWKNQKLPVHPRPVSRSPGAPV